MDIEELNRKYWTHCANLAKEFNKPQWKFIRLKHFGEHTIDLNDHPNLITGNLSEYYIDFAVSVIDDQVVFPGDIVYKKESSNSHLSYNILEKQTNFHCLRLGLRSEPRITSAHRIELTLKCPLKTVELSLEECDIILKAFEYYPFYFETSKETVNKLKRKLEI